MIIIITWGKIMSKQRQIVLNVVNESMDHPTAETVLLRCKQIMPSINLATVYRNLKTLVSQGMVYKISQEDGDRFDKTLRPHAHFKCSNCGVLTDLLEVDVESIKNEVEKRYSYKVNDLNFLFKGTCERCAKIQTII